MTRYTAPMHCVLIGNYGVANLGDEALRAYFLETFPLIEWTVLSASPSKTGELYRLPGGIRSFIRTPWWRTVRAIRRADAVVFGGGSLFTDVESVYACMLWALHILVARLCGTPVFLAFQGMGPYRTRLGEGIARWSARQAVHLSVRDAASAERMAAWGLSIKVVQTFDPVFAHMHHKKVVTEPKNVFIVIPRRNSGRTCREEVQRLLQHLPTVEEVRLVLMQPDDPAEREFAESLHAQLPLPAVIVPVRSMNALMEEVSGARHVLTQRFHGALAALAAGTPMTVLPQGTKDKLWEVKKYEGEHPDVDALLQMIARGEEGLRAACEAGKSEHVSV